MWGVAGWVYPRDNLQFRLVSLRLPVSLPSSPPFEFCRTSGGSSDLPARPSAPSRSRRRVPSRPIVEDLIPDSDSEGLLDRQGASSDEGEDSTQERQQFEEPAAPRRPSSDRGRLREAVQTLFEVRPEVFASPSDHKQRRSLSSIEVVLGVEPEDFDLPPLRESPLIASALSTAFKKVSGMG